MTIYEPLDPAVVTGAWANSPWYYEQFGQLGHNGIDYGTGGVTGKPVYATAEGVVSFAGWGGNEPSGWTGDVAGNYVRIVHSALGIQSGYAHLQGWLVAPGQVVKPGQLIATSGNTSGSAAGSTGPHLHFETLPLFPNYYNGFAGRIDPNSLNLRPMSEIPGTKPVPPVIPIGSDDMKVVRVKFSKDGKAYWRWFLVGGGELSVEVTEAQSAALTKIWGARKTVTSAAIQSYDTAIKRLQAGNRRLSRGKLGGE